MRPSTAAARRAAPAAAATEAKPPPPSLPDLPQPLLAQILLLLDPVERGRAARICRALRAAVDDPALWPDMQLRLGVGTGRPTSSASASARRVPSWFAAAAPQAAPSTPAGSPARGGQPPIPFDEAIGVLARARHASTGRLLLRLEAGFLDEAPAALRFDFLRAVPLRSLRIEVLPGGPGTATLPRGLEPADLEAIAAATGGEPAEEGPSGPSPPGASRLARLSYPPQRLYERGLAETLGRCFPALVSLDLQTPTPPELVPGLLHSLPALRRLRSVRLGFPTPPGAETSDEECFLSLLSGQAAAAALAERGTALRELRLCFAPPGRRCPLHGLPWEDVLTACAPRALHLRFHPQEMYPGALSRLRLAASPPPPAPAPRPSRPGAAPGASAPTRRKRRRLGSGPRAAGGPAGAVPRLRSLAVRGPRLRNRAALSSALSSLPLAVLELDPLPGTSLRPRSAGAAPRAPRPPGAGPAPSRSGAPWERLPDRAPAASPDREWADSASDGDGD
eukprot:tig00001042_g6592.t1